MKYIITENQMRRLEFKYLDYLFEDMYEVESEEYPDSRLWKKDKKVILELRNSGYLWVSYSIWNNISGMFSLNDNEAKQLIKDWVEQHLELGGITPRILFTVDSGRWNNI
jgi:hypothetical protein